MCSVSIKKNAAEKKGVIAFQWGGGGGGMGFCCLTSMEVRRPIRDNNNNNNVHLSCAHQCPERSHDTY